MVEDTYKLGSVPIADELYAQSYGCQKSSSTHCAEHGGASEPARDTFPLNAPPRGDSQCISVLGGWDHGGAASMIRASASPHCFSEANAPSHMALQRKLPAWATSPPCLLRIVSINSFFITFRADEGMFSFSNRTLSSNERDFADGVVVDVEGPALPCAEARGVVWGGSAQVPCAETLASDLGRGTDIGVFPPLRQINL